jgi:uncharacterized cupin superfamily protein
MASPSIDRRLGLAANLAFKAPVALATTANITLSGEQSIDGTTTSESRVLVKDQTTTSENGIYDTSSGTWTRAIDANGNYDLVKGTTVVVTGGTANAGLYFQITTPAPTIGTSSIVWTLALTSSTSALGFIQDGSGAVSRGAQSKMREAVTPADFDILADGTTNELTKVQSWLAQAATAGAWADGLGKTIAITGDLDISSYTGLKLRDVTFKQLSWSATRKTLTATSNANLHLRRVKINRNGDGTSGSISTAAGIWLVSCSDLLLEDCEVTGNDEGNGIVLLTCERAKLIRPYIHDIRYVQVAQADDVVQGIWLRSCDDILIDTPRIEKLGRTDSTSSSRDRFSRGIAFSACRGAIVDNPNIYRVDQAIDVTGSGGNSGIVVIGGNIRHVHAFGVKFANSATGCRATGTVIESAGLGGCVASGPVSGQLNSTQNIVFDGITARNTGSNLQWAASSIRAFSADTAGGSAPYLAFPKGIKFRNCDAISDEGNSIVTIASVTTLTLASPIPVSLGARVQFTTSGTLPTGLSLATNYWLVPIRDTMTVSVATSYINAIDADELIRAGSSPTAKIVSTLASGSGNHTMTLFQDMYDGFYNSVSAANIDTGNPNTAENCRSAGHTNKAFNGIHAPVVIATNGGFSVPDSAFTALQPDTTEIDSMGLRSSAVFTVPSSGMWRMSCDGLFDADATGERRLKLQADTGGGYVDLVPTVYQQHQGAAIPVPVQQVIERYWARGTLLKWMGYQDTGGALGIAIRIVLEPANVHGGTI